MRENPRHYLRRRTLNWLGDFLGGFCIASHGAKYGNYTTEGEPPFHDFTVWFELHHGYPTPGWFPAIKAQSRSSREAFDRFFEHLEAYRARRLKLRSSFAISSEQRKRCSAVLKMRPPKRLRVSQYAGEQCVFLHACWNLRHGWQYHMGFRSMKQCRQWLAETYGVTPSQWRRIATAVTRFKSSPQNAFRFRWVSGRE